MSETKPLSECWTEIYDVLGEQMQDHARKFANAEALRGWAFDRALRERIKELESDSLAPEEAKA